MFDWDIFLSYGWSGNAISEGDAAWVARLEKQLQISLRTPLGRDVKIFRDTNATRSGSLTEILERALDHSRLFLFNVSPGSCQSNWCNWEIQRFLDRAESVPTRNNVILPHDRLFGVLMEPVPADQIPAALQPLGFRPYNLTRPVADRDGTRPVDWDQLAQVKSAEAEFDRLVIDLSKKLLQIKEHEEKRIPPTGVTVFLGSPPTAAHEKELLTPLRRNLLLRGHAVSLASPAGGEKEGEYRIRLAALLDQVQISVSILGEPRIPTGWSRSISTCQLLATRNRKTLSVFTWTDQDKQEIPPEVMQAAKKGDQHLDSRQPFSELSSAVLSRADECAIQAQAIALGARKTVVIAYCEEDLAYASAIVDRLQALGHPAQLALPPRKTGISRDRINRKLFRQFDALMVYYSQHEEWMFLTCNTAREVLGKPPKPAALVLHPPPPPKVGYDQVHFESLHRTDVNDFVEIDSWASKI